MGGQVSFCSAQLNGVNFVGDGGGARGAGTKLNQVFALLWKKNARFSPRIV